jgi:hypothetical protein
VKVVTQFNLETQMGRDAYSNCKFFGPDQEWSIGYQVQPGKAFRDPKTGEREIKQLDWYEYSPVLFGAMPFARSIGEKTFAKDHHDIQLSVKSLRDALGEDRANEILFKGQTVEDEMRVEGVPNWPGQGATLEEAVESADSEQSNTTEMDTYHILADIAKQQEGLDGEKAVKVGREMGSNNLRRIEMAVTALNQASNALAGIINDVTHEPNSSGSELKVGSMGKDEEDFGALFLDEENPPYVDDEEKTGELFSLADTISEHLDGTDVDDDTQQEILDAAEAFDDAETVADADQALENLLDLIEVEDDDPAFSDNAKSLFADIAQSVLVASDELEEKAAPRRGRGPKKQRGKPKATQEFSEYDEEEDEEEEEEKVLVSTSLSDLGLTERKGLGLGFADADD